jgi:hypothetical protein
MLFELKFTPDSIAGLDQIKIDEALGSLLRAHRRGHHVIVISRELCGYFLRVSDLTKSDRAMLERLSSEYAQRALLSDAASIFVKVTTDARDDFSIEGNARRISLLTLSQTRLLDPSVLLVENLKRDGLLYGEILKNHYDLHSCPYPHYEPMHGGGDDLPIVFEAQIQQTRIVCSIVDSDRAAPHASNSQKLLILKRIICSNGQALACAVTPPCREAENCVPRDILMALPSGKANVSRSQYFNLADCEERAACSPLEAFWLFADLKNGLCSNAFAKLSPDNQRWVENKLRAIGLDPNRDEIAGFGSRVFDQLLDDNELLSEFRTKTRHKLWREVFDIFVRSIIWVFAGGHRLAT